MLHTDSPVVLFAGGVPQYLTEIVALIVAGAVIAYLSFRLRLVPIVGFLIAGILIGPNALGLVRDQEIVDATAEIGVILLLFTIGIEFSLEKLARIQRLIFGGGTLQVGLSTLVVMGLLMPFGIDWRAALFTGLLVALSSTAIVLKILGDTGETNSEPGQASLGLLIFQDLAIVAMVLIVPMLAGTDGTGGALGIVWALVKALLIVAAVLLEQDRVYLPAPGPEFERGRAGEGRSGGKIFLQGRAEPAYAAAGVEEIQGVLFRSAFYGKHFKKEIFKAQRADAPFGPDRGDALGRQAPHFEGVILEISVMDAGAEAGVEPVL